MKQPPILKGAFWRSPAIAASVLLSALVSPLSDVFSDAPKENAVYTITLHDLPDSSAVLYPAFDAWLREHPRVRAVRPSQLSIGNLERGSLLMSIAGGTAPDILHVYEHEVKAWIRNGFFEKLDPYIYKDVDGDGKYTEGVDEVIWKPFLNIPKDVRSNFIMEDGHIYTLPCFHYYQYFVYRRDIFADSGVDPDKRIETFDDLIYVCRKLTDPNAKIPGAKVPRGRKGFGITPNGWIWQGFLYACGGESLHILKDCPKCGKESDFPQSESRWLCSHCGASLQNVKGKERAAFESPEAQRAVKLWLDMLWAPFVKCPHCGEPVGLGDYKTKLSFPMKADCPFCKKSIEIPSEDKAIYGCARACIGKDSDVLELWQNGEIAMTNTYTLDTMLGRNIDPQIVGTMPFPEHGGASAFHQYGIYAGSKDREGGSDRIKVCAEMILDYVAQFYAPVGSPDYLKYDKMRVRKLVEDGFYTLCTYDELAAAGLMEYAEETSPAVREMQRLIRDPKHYTFLPPSEGYNRVQGEVLGQTLLSQICYDRDFDIDANLKRANQLADTQVFMKDEIVQETMRKYRWAFISVVVLLVALVVFLIRKFLIKGEGSIVNVNKMGKKMSFGRRAAAILLLAPAIVLLLMWAYYPLLRGSVMAFQEVKVLSSSHFVGFENFVRVVTNPLFPSVVKATLIYVVACLSLGFMAPVFLAILLSEATKGATIYRAIYYAPYLLGGVVVFFIWRIFYLPTEEGFFNHLISYFGLGPIRWLEDPTINKWMLALPGIWAGTGSACLVYLAALKSIDDEMYEAAELDGANALQKVIHVTLPMLKPLLVINFVGAFIGAFHGMGNILVLTGGAYETNVIGLQVFLEAFAYLRFGSSTALAWILGSLLIGFTIYQLSFLRKVEFRRAK